MTYAQRLRKLANSTGLDAFGDEIRAIADEMDEQPAEVTLDEVMQAAKEATAPEWQDVVDGWHMGLDLMAFARAIIALRPVQSTFCEYCGGNDEEPVDHCMDCTRPVQVPMTDELFDLICNAIDKADTITMEGDYMLDSDDCIAVVRVMQALLSVHHGITAQAKKEQA